MHGSQGKGSKASTYVGIGLGIELITSLLDVSSWIIQRIMVVIVVGGLCGEVMS